MNRRIDQLMQELQGHPHCDEILQLMYEQLEED